MCKAFRKRAINMVTGTVALVALCTPALAQQKNPERNAYFGETHLHTSWSVDAWLFGNHLTGPADAYKYAKGETIKHPLGYDIKIDTPLDFMGVTDHSEYVGVTKDGEHAGFAGQQAARGAGPHHHGSQEQGAAAARLRVARHADVPAARQGTHDPGSGRPDLEGEHQDRRRRTTIPASSPRSARTSGPRNSTTATCTATSSSATAPRCRSMPFSALDSWHPEELWNWMDAPAQGRQRTARHLAQRQPVRRLDVSDRRRQPRPADRRGVGRVARSQRAADRDQADRRDSRRPIRCCRPTTSSRTTRSTAICWDFPPDSGRIHKIVGSYARQALKDGLTMQDTRGYNPYKFGFGGRLRLAQHRHRRTARTTSSAGTPSKTEPSRRACPATSSPASTCDS